MSLSESWMSKFNQLVTILLKLKSILADFKTIPKIEDFTFFY